jgi:hypothetical protein
MDGPRPKTPGSGRQKGTPNKKTLARYEAEARVNAALAAMGKDTLTGMKLLQEVLNHPDTPLSIKIQCAGLLVKQEAPQASETKYVAVMPLPVKDMDEWKKLHMEQLPNATPEEFAWHEKLAKQVLDSENGPPVSKLPWLDKEENQ